MDTPQQHRYGLRRMHRINAAYYCGRCAFPDVFMWVWVWTHRGALQIGLLQKRMNIWRIRLKGRFVWAQNHVSYSLAPPGE